MKMIGVRMEDLKISKELLLQIMPLEHNQKFDQVYEAKFHNALNVGYHYDIVFEGKSIGYGAKYYNIYQIVFMLKEWAFKEHNVIINSRTTSKDKVINGYAELIKNCDYLYSTYKDSEIEAIINACEWILRETGN